MTTLTIPKEMIQKNDDLVLIPRKEYEEFLRTEKPKKSPTDLAIDEGLRDLRAGKVTPPFASVKEFKRFLKQR